MGGGCGGGGGSIENGLKCYGSRNKKGERGRQKVNERRETRSVEERDDKQNTKWTGVRGIEGEKQGC